MKRVLFVAVASLVLAAAPSFADVLRLHPTAAVVLPADASGATKVALQFDLSGARTGRGRVVDSATLDWRPAGQPTDAASSFELVEILTAWTPGMSAVDLGRIAVLPGTVSTWYQEPADITRTGAARIRLDVTELASGWLSGSRANHGVVIVTPSLDRRVIAAELSKALLTVRYGFR